jgi:hypothetical protein
VSLDRTDFFISVVHLQLGPEHHFWTSRPVPNPATRANNRA